MLYGTDQFSHCRDVCTKQCHGYFMHADCFSITPTAEPPARSTMWERLKASDFLYVPSEDEFSYHDRAIETSLGSELKKTFKVLPLEVCLAIAPKLSQLYTSAQRGVSFGGHGYITVSLKKRIWAKYVTFGGLEYMSALTNQEPVKITGWQMVHDPEKKHKSLHMACDYFGLRDMIFTDGALPGEESQQPHAWWQHFLVEDLIGELKVRRDVSCVLRLFLRFPYIVKAFKVLMQALNRLCRGLNFVKSLAIP